MRRRSARGFTILELMVVLAIAGIMVAYALPEMKDLVISNRMKTLSLDVYTSMTMARSESIKRNANNVSVIANAGGWQNGWKVCVDANSNGACDSGEVVLVENEAVDASLTLTNTGGTVVTYSRDGRVSGASSFRILAASYPNSSKLPMRCVEVNASGRPGTRVDTNATDSDGCN
jgi:type IV fimbrial biogenesis protein FimT